MTDQRGKKEKTCQCAVRATWAITHPSGGAGLSRTAAQATRTKRRTPAKVGPHVEAVLDASNGAREGTGAVGKAHAEVW